MSDRYSTLTLTDDVGVIYDRENPNCWLQFSRHDVVPAER